MKTIKKLVTLVLALGFVLYLTSNASYAFQATKQRPAPNRPAVERREDRRDTRQDDRKDTRQDRRDDRGDITPGNDAREDRRDERQDARKDAVTDRWQDRLQANPQLRTKVQGMLPSGATLANASSGFKNQGQFIATLNASKNLKIPFNDLKAKMTGPEQMSLGDAIHSFRPNLPQADIRREVEKAEKQAQEMEKAST